MTDDREIPQAENVGAWILGALDEDEARAFAAELERSQALRDEVERLQPVGDVLAMGADQMDPPPALRDRLMATVRSEAQLRRAAEGVPHPVAPVPAAPAARRARRSWLGLRPGLAVGLACAAAALVAVTAVLVTSGDEGSPTPGPAPAVAFRITTPGASSVTVSATRSRSCRTTTTMRAGSRDAAVSSTCPTSGRPPTACRIFGVRDRMRVPWPAARTTTASSVDEVMLRRQDSNLDLTAPKAVVLPLHHGGPCPRAPVKSARRRPDGVLDIMNE